MIKRVLEFLRKHKKGTLITLGAVVSAACLGAYSAWSISTWSSYTAHYETWQKTGQASLDKALLSKTGADRLTALKKASHDVNEGKKSACETSVFISWQSSVFPSLRTQKTACQEAIEKMSSVSARIDVLIGYLQDEQWLISILSKPDIKKAEITEGDFAAQVTTWQSAADTVKNMTAGTAFTPVKDKTQVVLAGIAQAWSKIVGAHTAKDKDKYAAAVGDLSTAYQTLGSINDINQKQYKALLDDLQKG